MLPVSLRSACDISRACRPMCWSPISPSISAFGVSAATESTTMMSTAPERTSMSVISSACSPVSGCEIRRSSTLTPTLRAYSGSSACSASTNAAVPPTFCSSAIDLQRERRLARRLRAVDLDDSAARQAADAESDVEPERAGRHRFDVARRDRVAEAHDRAFAELLFDLSQRSGKRFLAVFVHSIVQMRGV